MPIINWESLPSISLKDKILRTLAEWANAVLEGFVEYSPWLKPGYWDKVFESWEKRFTDPLVYFILSVMVAPAAPALIPAAVARIVALPRVLNLFKIGALLAIAFGGAISSALVMPFRAITMHFSRQAQLARSSSMQLANARIGGWIDDERYFEDMLDMGFSRDRAVWLLNEGLRWPSIGYTFDLLNRGEITEEQAVQFLRRQGLEEGAARFTLKLRMEIPNIQDLIRFAVREAYTPSAIEELGLHQEFPEEIMPDATKRGLSHKYALDYWAAHWQLPSVSQVFEMLHRRVKDAKGNVFDQAAMARFLKYADYALPWRQMLIDISYNPFTRRELPRLFRLGVIKEKEMKDAYLDIGLSPERAQVLVDASIREAREASRDLTRADIEAGYKRHLISPETTSTALASLGYDEDEVAYILARIDYDKVQARVSSRKATIKRRYISGLIGHELAIRQLSEAGVEAEEIPDLIADWTEEREAKVERPTVDQLYQMYRRRIILGPELVAELAGHGYNARYIKLMMANIEAEIAEENARKSEAQKRREAVRVKLPTKADLLDWLRDGIITQDDMRQRMRNQGYLDEDIDRYLREEGIVVVIPAYRTEEGQVRLATLKLQYRAGIITIGDLLTGLLALEVPPSLADAIIAYETLRLPPPPEVPVVVPVPFYRTEEGRVRLATLKAQVREGLISLGELVSGLLALEVPPSLADALAEYEEVKLGPAAA